MPTRYILVAGLVSSFLLIQYFSRHQVLQHYYIKRRLKQAPHFNFTIPVMTRQEEEKELSDFLTSNPWKPLVIIGSDGSGKGYTLRNALSGRPMTVMVDLRNLPLSTANELIYHFVQSVGYFLPPAGFFVRWLLKEKASEKRPRIQRETVDSAFRIIRKIFENIKMKGNGIPVVIISDLEISGISANDPEFNILMNFIISLSEDGLCHFIFPTTRNFSMTVLDRYPGWKGMREVYQWSAAQKSEVIPYLNQMSLNLAKRGIILTESDIASIFSILGGAMDDISAVIISLMRHRPLEATIEKLVTESILLVKSLLEAHATDGNENYKKYLNLWDMIELFNTADSIPRATLINEIFKDEWQDLDYYEEKGLIQFSLKLDGKIRALIHNQDQNFGLDKDTVDVFPAKQRVKLAFKFVLVDSQIVQRTQRIKKKYKKKKLQKELEELSSIYDRLQNRRTFALEEQVNFLKYHDTLKLLIGDKLIHQHGALIERLDDNELQIEAIYSKIIKVNDELQLMEE